MSGKIFVSYRHGEEGTFFLNLLTDRLMRSFDAERIFWDAKIEGGANYVKYIEHAIAESSVFLVLIGLQWSPERLFNPEDFLRKEIKAALDADILIVPLLFQNASIPSKERMPPDLLPLIYYQAITFDPSNFNAAYEKLVSVIKGAPKRKSDRDARPPRGTEGVSSEEGIYPRTLLVGLGGAGVQALKRVRRLIIERLGALDHAKGISFLAIDTDSRSWQPLPQQQRDPLGRAISFSRDEVVTLKIDLEKLGVSHVSAHPWIREWRNRSALPYQDFDLDQGMDLNRLLGRLAFCCDLDKVQEGLEKAYQKVTPVGAKGRLRVVVVASLAGGTGSAIFLDLAAFLKGQLAQHRERLRLEAFLLLPGFLGVTNLGKAFPRAAANSYAALREINHYLSHPLKVQWDGRAKPIEVLGLYERYLLFSGVNASNELLNDPLDGSLDGYPALSEILLLDLGTEPMASWLQGVRVNRHQSLNSVATMTYKLTRPEGGTLDIHGDQWKTAFSSAGVSKLVLPSWRLINKAKYKLAAELVALLASDRAAKMANTPQDQARLERVSERLTALQADYESFASFYDTPQRSHIIYEIKVPSQLGDLLEPFLGRDLKERELRLQNLLFKALRQMNLGTLKQLDRKLEESYEGFRDDLAAQAFYALRGEDGWTTAFARKPGEATPGFIERYQILKVLKENFDEPRRREIYDHLYRKGLPWAQPNRTEAIVTEYKPHGDAFLGCIHNEYQDVEREMLQRMQGGASSLFYPRLVRGAYDPSEIIFYTELAAFPAYYLSELSDLKRHYETLLNDTKAITPLHIDQDYQQFQPLMPFSGAQLERYKHAWQVFIKAQMLGLVQSLRLWADDDTRIAYRWYRRVGAFDIQRFDLGAEGRAIERLMLSEETRNHLQGEIEREENRFLALPSANLCHLIALADYYAYCIFPVRTAVMASGATILGSVQNFVCNELRDEWRSEQRRNEPDSRRLEEGVRHVLRELAVWSKPIYRDPRQPVPSTSEIPEEERLEEWGLASSAVEAVHSFMSRGMFPQARDTSDPILRFPRLALDWTYFVQDMESGALPPSVS